MADGSLGGQEERWYLYRPRQSARTYETYHALVDFRICRPPNPPLRNDWLYFTYLWDYNSRYVEESDLFETEADALRAAIERLQASIETRKAPLTALRRRLRQLERKGADASDSKDEEFPGGIRKRWSVESWIGNYAAKEVYANLSDVHVREYGGESILVWNTKWRPEIPKNKNSRANPRLVDKELLYLTEVEALRVALEKEKELYDYFRWRQRREIRDLRQRIAAIEEGEKEIAGGSLY